MTENKSELLKDIGQLYSSLSHWEKLIPIFQNQLNSKSYRLDITLFPEGPTHKETISIFAGKGHDKFLQLSLEYIHTVIEQLNERLKELEQQLALHEGLSMYERHWE